MSMPASRSRYPMKQMQSSSRIVQQFRAEQPYRITSVGAAVEISQSKILLPKEEAAADALIAGVVELVPGLERAGFNRHLRIQPTDAAHDLGRVTLVVTYDNALPAQVSISQVSKAMQALATQGLVASFERVALPRQLPLVPTGAEFEPPELVPVAQASPIAADRVGLKEVGQRAFESACVTTKNHFASKLGGQSLEARVRVESAQGNFIDIAGTVIKPKRSTAEPRTDSIVGVLNAIIKDPPEIKVLGSMGGATKRALTVAYTFTPQVLEALAKELVDVAAPELVFSVLCNTETVIGRNSSTAYTLISYQRSKPIAPSQVPLELERASA